MIDICIALTFNLEIIETIKNDVYSMRLLIVDAAHDLPLNPAFNTGDRSQGVAYEKPLDPGGLRHRASRWLKTCFSLQDKGSHHTGRKAYAQSK